jgi:hypothetical protein
MRTQIAKRLVNLNVRTGFPFHGRRVDLEQREVALAFLRRADLALDGIAGAQSEAADLRFDTTQRAPAS